MSYAEQQMKAHQYLYYVLNRPVITDYAYDQLCRMHNLEGGGGSDRECDYSDDVKHMAMKMLSEKA